VTLSVAAPGDTNPSDATGVQCIWPAISTDSARLSAQIADSGAKNCKCADIWDSVFKPSA